MAVRVAVRVAVASALLELELNAAEGQKVAQASQEAAAQQAAADTHQMRSVNIKTGAREERPDISALDQVKAWRTSKAGRVCSPDTQGGTR